MDAFFFYPKRPKKPKEGRWCSSSALGHNTLRNTAGRLCKKESIEGLKTTHSLRATAAMWLHQHGVNKQFALELTGRRSVDGTRSYK